MSFHRIPTKYYLVAAVFSIILAVHVFTLMRFPAPHGDEAWMAGRAWEFVRSGSSFGPLDGGVLDRFEGYQYFYPWLSSAIQSLGARLFGEPSVLAMRSVSLVIGVGLLLAVYSIGVALDGNMLGLFSVAFTAFSWPFFISAHVGRPDIITTALGYGAIALHLHNRLNRLWLSALAGFLALLAFEVHAHGAVFTPTILALFFWKYRRRTLRTPGFWGFIAGAVLGFAFYLGLHVLPAPQTFIKLNQLVFSATHIPPLLTFDITVIWNAVIGMFMMILSVYPQGFIGIWAAIRLSRKRVPYAGTLIVLNAALLIAYILLVRNKFLLYYAILFTPALSLLTAAFFHDFLQAPVKRAADYKLRRFAAIAVCVVQMMVILLKFSDLPAYQYVQFQVDQAVKPGDVIMANQLYWFGLRDHKYYSWENLVFFRRYLPGSNLEEAFNSLKPDIFIVDDQVEQFISDGEYANSYVEGFHIPKSELESFLNQHAELITIISSEDEKTVKIYRINWEKPDP